MRPMLFQKLIPEVLLRNSPLDPFLVFSLPFLDLEQMRKLAVDMEVKHGRVALGAVVCAMAQHGLVSVGC